MSGDNVSINTNGTRVCKKCAAIRTANWTAKNADLVRARKRASAALAREASRAEREEKKARAENTSAERKKSASTTWARRNPDVLLSRKYGITTDDIRRMAEAQSHKCLICKEKKKLVVDHCHSGGQVRGLLCGTCNVGLGMFQDNPIFLREAIFYLSRTRGPRRSTKGSRLVLRRVS